MAPALITPNIPNLQVFVIAKVHKDLPSMSFAFGGFSMSCSGTRPKRTMGPMFVDSWSRVRRALSPPREHDCCFKGSPVSGRRDIGEVSIENRVKATSPGLGPAVIKGTFVLEPSVCHVIGSFDCCIAVLYRKSHMYSIN